MLGSIYNIVLYLLDITGNKCIRKSRLLILETLRTIVRHDRTSLFFDKK